MRKPRLTRRDLLVGSLGFVAAAGSAAGVAWYVTATAPRPLPLSEPSAELDDVRQEFVGQVRTEPGVIGSRRYNSFAHFDPSTRQITLYYNLLPQIVPDRAWTGKSFTIDYEGPDGIYDVVTDAGHVAWVAVTRRPEAAPKANLVIMPDYTLHAYNRLGGGSLYTGPQWVSMDRPAVLPWYSSPAYHPLDFMSANGLEWDLIKQSDLDFMPPETYDLSAYRRLVIYGHDEYWSPNIRQRIDDAVAAGTDLVNLSGNTCYWGISLDGRTINRDKLGHFTDNPDLPPEWDLLGNAFVWAGYPIGRKAAAGQLTQSDMYQFELMGLAFNQTDGEFPVDLTSSVRVIDEHVSALQGTGSKKGEWISDPSDILGVEIDGLPLTRDGSVDLGKTFGFEPDELEIACEGWGMTDELPTHLGFILKSRFRKGGYVWSNSSISWLKTLMNGNPVTTQVTLNAFR